MDMAKNLNNTPSVEEETNGFDATQVIDLLKISAVDFRSSVSGGEYYIIEFVINNLPRLRELIKKPISIAEFACHLEEYAKLLRKGPPKE